MTFTPVRVHRLIAVGLVMVVGGERGRVEGGLMGETQDVEALGATVASDLIEADAVSRKDTVIFVDRERDLRRVRVTITAREGTETLVIEPTRELSRWGTKGLQFLEQNGQRILAPRRVKHVVLRQRGGGQLKGEIVIQLGRCDQLNLMVEEDGEGAEQLNQEHKKESCCP